MALSEVQPDVRVAARILGECVDLRAGEHVTVITDGIYPQEIPSAFVSAAASAGAAVEVLSTPPSGEVAENLPLGVVESLGRQEVLVLCTTALFPRPARQQAARRGARVLSLCGIDAAIYRRSCDLNHHQVARVTEHAALRLAAGGRYHVTSKEGTDLILEVAPGAPIQLTGLARCAGEIAVLPAGVLAVLPVPGTARGRAVVTGSIEGLGLCETPVALEVADGRVVEIAGGRQAAALARRLREGDTDSFILAETGFGTNPRAGYSGNILEDERVAGSCHIGLGQNAHLGGPVWSRTHLDLTIRAPTVRLNGDILIEHGVLQIAA